MASCRCACWNALDRLLAGRGHTTALAAVRTYLLVLLREDLLEDFQGGVELFVRHGLQNCRVA